MLEITLRGRFFLKIFYMSVENEFENNNEMGSGVVCLRESGEL